MRKPLVARQEWSGVITIVAQNGKTGEYERVEVPQHHVDHVIKQLRLLREA